MAEQRKGLEIPIRATGRKDVQRVMRGVVADAEKAARDAAKAQQRAEREAQRATQRAEAARRKEREKSAREAKQVEGAAARERIKLERHVQRQVAKSITDIGRHRIREAEKAARAEQRIAERTAREVRRTEARAAQRRAGFRRAMISGAATVGGAALGGGMAALGVARNAQGALGIRTQEDVLGSAITSKLDFIRTARQAGLDRAGRENVFGEATAIGQRTGLGPEQIMAAISKNQELFSGLSQAVQSGTLPAFMAQIENMGQVAMASGAELSEVVTTAGEFQRQLSLSTEETSDALAILAQGAQDGSLNFADFAGAFPQALSQLANLRGSQGRGVGAVREFQALAQGLKAGGVSAETARVLQENLLNSLSNPETRKRIERAGVSVLENELDAEGNVRRDERGRPIQRMRNTADILREMTSDSDFQGPRLAGLIHDAQARRAVEVLMGQEQRAARGEGGALTLAQRQASSVEGGRRLIAETNRDIMSDEVGGVLRDRATREAEVFRNMDELIGHYQKMSEWLTELENKYPVLTAQLGSVAEVAGGIGLGALGTKALTALFGGGTAATATTAAAGALSGTGAAAAGGGLLGPALGALASGIGFSSIWGARGEGVFNAAQDQWNHDSSKGSRWETLWGSMRQNLGGEGSLDPMAQARQAIERQMGLRGGGDTTRATETQTREIVGELRKATRAMERVAQNTQPSASPGDL